MKLKISRNRIISLVDIAREASVVIKLKNILTLPQDNLNHKDSQMMEFELSEEEVQEILDELTTRLVEQGINLDNEPNRFGLIVEDLIDVFAREFYHND